jgi:hypothetical protein
MKKPYTLALFAALNGDGSYQYTSQIWPEHGDRGSRPARGEASKKQEVYLGASNARR